MICKMLLGYLKAGISSECEIRHKKENGKTRGIHGRYVCNDCHTKGLDGIIGVCMAETSKNPLLSSKDDGYAFCGSVRFFL
jgi:hypothetical protein